MQKNNFQCNKKTQKKFPLKINFQDKLDFNWILHVKYRENIDFHKKIFLTIYQQLNLVGTIRNNKFQFDY